MKTTILLGILFLATTLSAQNKMTTQNGKIIFEASVPSFEDVSAINNYASCALITSSGKFSCYVSIKKFQFKLSLMQHHFNKNYMESDRYPKASFKGIIQEFNINNIGNTPKEFTLKGKLTIHGISKEISALILLRKIDDKIEITSNFKVDIDDYNIEIPSLLIMKVSKTVNITSDFFVN